VGGLVWLHCPHIAAWLCLCVGDLPAIPCVTHQQSYLVVWSATTLQAAVAEQRLNTRIAIDAVLARSVVFGLWGGPVRLHAPYNEPSLPRPAERCCHRSPL